MGSNMCVFKFHSVTACVGVYVQRLSTVHATIVRLFQSSIFKTIPIMYLEDFFSTYDLGVSYYACLCFYVCVCAPTVFDILCIDVKVIKMVTMRTPIQGKAWLTSQGMSTRV